ncbi:DUF2867 domain-containing protein [Sorangium sp. So ce590]|uniref:DUF2867 domain-containing protein n=1 Tax=Sorangium sp. So ce590 TaxID=3133317 RepID=UPI003F643196
MPMEKRAWAASEPRGTIPPWTLQIVVDAGRRGRGFACTPALRPLRRQRGAARTIEDVRALLRPPESGSSSALVRALFWLRGALGKLFGWDPVEEGLPPESYVHQVPSELARRSSVQPGTREGPFRALYVLHGEAVSEIRNATVHAFSCMAIRPTAEGHRLYWAVYVKPVSRWTSAYMALIEPFRRFIVYPTLLRQLRDAWRAAHAEPDAATEHGGSTA